MPIITCDIRTGRTKDQKSRLAAGLLKALQDVTSVDISQTFLVIREMPGFNFVDAGEHVPEYVSGPEGRDLAGEEQLRSRGERQSAA